MYTSELDWSKSKAISELHERTNANQDDLIKQVRNLSLFITHLSVININLVSYGKKFISLPQDSARKYWGECILERAMKN